MKQLLQQIKERRQKLNLKQSDMLMRAGFSRQQYQRLEASGNPRLDTLELLAKGLDAELVLVPKEKLGTVRLIVSGSADPVSTSDPMDIFPTAEEEWPDFLGGDE